MNRYLTARSGLITALLVAGLAALAVAVPAVRPARVMTRMEEEGELSRLIMGPPFMRQR